MISANLSMHTLTPQAKPCEGRVAPARMARLTQAQSASFLYDQERWNDLPARIANAYVRFEDKSQQAIRERITM